MEESKINSQAVNVEELKNKGNECVEDGKLVEAIVYYTQALRLDPNNYVLYSNRSLVFLKLDQHHLSLEDANETIRLKPRWAKGYYRRAEAQAASEWYEEAMISYTRALQLEPHNPKIMESIKKIKKMENEKMKGYQITIWICTCIGFIIGISVVAVDYFLVSNPILTQPLYMMAFLVAMTALGWTMGKSSTLLHLLNTGKSFEPPTDLVSKYKNETEATIPEKKTKYSKAQARQRYKQGKL